METLLKQNNKDIFLIEFEKDESDFEYSITFSVYEAISWNGINQVVEETELYLKGFIKWDGCSHLYFGDKGYIHLCGKVDFENHKKVLDAVWEVASKKIKNWDDE